MSDYRLSRLAVSDIRQIITFTYERFGRDQAAAYHARLEQALSLISRNPQLGRSAARYAAELRRHEVMSHIVFYTADENGVLVVRVLHRQADPERHF